MITFNQRNKLWANLNLGTSGVGFTRNGCTTCAILTGYSTFYTEHPLLPTEALNIFKYTDFGRRRGLIMWYATKFPGMEFIGRYFSGPSHDKLTEIQNDPEQFMILELDYGAHWVYFYHNTIKWLPWILVVDSWMKNPVTLHGKIRTTKKQRVTGYAIFRKDESTE